MGKLNQLFSMLYFSTRHIGRDYVFLHGMLISNMEKSISTL